MQKRGVVLGLLSSDTYAIKIIDDPKTPIMAVALENVVCPRLGTNDGRAPDEPNAWPAFDFARKGILGKRVLVEQFGKTPDQKRTHPSFGPLQVIYARVALVDSDNQDVGLLLVTEGWAKLREKTRSDDDYVSTLTAAQQAAKDSHLGIWQPNGLVRSLPVPINPSALVKKEFDAIIETVMNGSTFGVLLLPSFSRITLSLAGIRCPSAKRAGPEPYGIEAKTFVETRLLQRQVHVFVLSYSDETDMFGGRVLHPVGGDIAPLLLSEGLATIHTPSLVYLDSAAELRAAETAGKTRKKNIFHDFDISSLRSQQVNGRVQAIKGSSSLDVDTGSEIRRVFLSGCKIPNFLPDQKYDPRALECRERLRKLLVGRQVQCLIDYTVDSRQYATVFLGNQCVNETLLGEGLATIVLSKAGQSDNIDQFMKLEAAAKAQKLGLHSGPPANLAQLNDLSNKHTHQRSFPFLHFLENKRQRGVIEYFASCTRLSVLIPSQNCVIRLNLNGVSPSDANSRLGAEALKFVNDEFLQRDAEFEITAVDKVGCFIGTAYVDFNASNSPSSRSTNPKSTNSNKVNLTALVVERGFVELSASAGRCKDYAALEDAEERARAKGLGVWSDAGKRRFRMEFGQAYSVTMINVWDAVTVVLQLNGKEQAMINQLLPQAKVPAVKPMKGDFLAAIFDGKIYRVIVLNVDFDREMAQCEFVEDCITDNVPFKDLRILPQALAAIPPQAFSAKLACCKEFKVDEAFQEAAMAYLEDLVGDGAVYAHLVRNGKRPEVLLTDAEDVNSGSVNSMMLSEGWACFQNIDGGDEFAEIIRDLEEIKEEAQRQKKGGWEHGNIAGDEDEEEDQ